MCNSSILSKTEFDWCIFQYTIYVERSNYHIPSLALMQRQNYGAESLEMEEALRFALSRSHEKEHTFDEM